MAALHTVFSKKIRNFYFFQEEKKSSTRHMIRFQQKPFLLVKCAMVWYAVSTTHRIEGTEEQKMKKMLCTLLVLLLALCPLAAMADGLYAQLVTSGEQTTVLFTDEAGDTYLLVIDENGVSATKVSGAQAQPAVVYDPCWRCGESLSYGDHTCGDCGYKYHSACMDEYFKDAQGHELCAICGKCMYSSGSRHGIGFGLCGAAIMQEKSKCARCGLDMDQHYKHGNSNDATKECWVHCWISEEPHAACAICGKPLCNGEEHSEKGCAKKVKSNG